MRLTLVNFFKKTVPGHIFRGKKRLVTEVTRKSMNQLINDYEVQERNMLLLRHPFITHVSLINDGTLQTIKPDPSIWRNIDI